MKEMVQVDRSGYNVLRCLPSGYEFLTDLAQIKGSKRKNKSWNGGQMKGLKSWMHGTSEGNSSSWARTWTVNLVGLVVGGLAVDNMSDMKDWLFSRYKFLFSLPFVALIY